MDENSPFTDVFAYKNSDLSLAVVPLVVDDLSLNMVIFLGNVK